MPEDPALPLPPEPDDDVWPFTPPATAPLRPDPEPPLPGATEVPENSIPAKSLEWETVLASAGVTLYRVPVPGGWLYRCVEELHTYDASQTSLRETMTLQFVPRPALDAHAAYVAQLDAELRERRARSAVILAAGMRVPGAGSA